MRRRVEGREREVRDGNTVSLRETPVESRDVAADGGCGSDECKAGVLDAGRGVSEEEVVKTKVDEGGEGTYANKK